MAALHSVKHFHYIFTTNVDNSVSKMEAHVFALCREEADLLFNKEAPKVWAMLDVIDKGTARHFMIAGKRYNSNKSYVASFNTYSPEYNRQRPNAFTEFVRLYRTQIANLPLLDFKKQLWDHKPHHIPTAEQFEILADETGEYVEKIKAYAMREFYEYAIDKAVQQFGRPTIEKIIGGSDVPYNSAGEIEEATLQKLKQTVPNFGVVRYYKMSAPDLLYFHDMNRGTFSDEEIYSGQKSLLDFPKRVIQHLCTIDSRFGTLLVKDKQGTK